MTPWLPLTGCRKLKVFSTFPTIAARGLVPTLSYFDANLEAVGAALANHLTAMLPQARADRSPPPQSGLVHLRLVAGQSHGPAPGRVRD